MCLIPLRGFPTTTAPPAVGRKPCTAGIHPTYFEVRARAVHGAASASSEPPQLFFKKKICSTRCAGHTISTVADIAHRPVT